MIIGNHLLKIQWLQSQLCTEFARSLFGPLSLYLGIDFFYNSSGILMSHHRYILCCLDELGLSDSYPNFVPMDSRLFAIFSAHMTSLLLMGSAITYHRCSIGKLLHVLNTCPDVAFAIGVCTRFTSTPREAHLRAILHIWSYLRGTSTLALHYQRRRKCTPKGFSDSDYLGDRDKRRSTSGIIFSLGTTPTSSKSKLQNEVAQSSSKTEYRSVAEASKEAMWYHNVFDELGMTLSKSISIMVDNMSCIKMAKDLVLQGQTKHIEKSYHFIQDHIKKGRIILHHVRFREQPPDILTKPLSKIQFIEARSRLSLITQEDFDKTNGTLLKVISDLVPSQHNDPICHPVQTHERYNRSDHTKDSPSNSDSPSLS